MKLHAIGKQPVRNTVKAQQLALNSIPVSGLLQVKLSPDRRWVLICQGLDVLAVSPASAPDFRLLPEDGRGQLTAPPAEPGPVEAEPEKVSKRSRRKKAA